MLKRIGLIIIALLLITSSIDVRPVLADEVDNLYDKAAEKYHELFRDTSFRKHLDNWLTTIKQFQLIYQEFPRHGQAPKALFNIGKLYRALYQWNQEEIYLDRSNIAFRTMVRDYRDSYLSDDAQYMLGENYELFRKDTDLAQVEYKKVLELFPEGSATEKAQKKLEQFRSVQEIAFEPNFTSASTPDDLTQPRFGGLSESESLNSESMVVSKVDYWSTIEWSRMVINIKGEVRYKYQLLKEDSEHPQKRLYIDLYNSYIPSGFDRKISAQDGLISQARIAQFDASTVRIVLDIESLDHIKIFHFKLPNQYKIVVDITGESSLGTALPEVTKKQQLSYEKPEKSGSAQQQDLSLSKALGLKVKTIIIDPGHGGKDPGAIGYQVQEKDVVLEIAKRLRDLIRINHPEITIYMTRSTDKFIELEARTAFANQHKGDLFISIHANASLKKDLCGIETYFLNLTTDDEALNLAAKENQTSLKSISDLQTILNDLMVNSKIKESRDLAETIQLSLIEMTGKSEYKMKDLGVKQAPFTVLIGAQMPSILIEAGFISNKEENKYLRDRKYRQIIASGIYNGIRDYMN